jgi:UDP-glucuronate decarboxylase
MIMAFTMAGCLPLIHILMDAPDKITGSINLGNPTEFTIRELAEKVLALTESTSVLSFHELPRDDPRQRKPDITRAQTALGWQPTVTLDNGLVNTIHYFRHFGGETR